MSDYDQEIHNHKPQSIQWRREEESHSHHKTSGRQTKQSNQLSPPHQEDCKTRMDISNVSNVKQNIEQLQTPTMELIIQTKSQQQQNRCLRPKQEPKPSVGGGGGGKCILLVPNIRPRFCCCC